MIQFKRPFSPQPLRLLIFDLDGTLIDSRLDLIHSVNAMLRHLKRPELAGEVVASYVGDGAPMLVRRALGEASDETLFTRALQYFLEYYRVHKLDYTQLYNGIKDALTSIRRRNPELRMAVLSNKPVNPSRAIVAALGLGEFFGQVYGGNSFESKKPDPFGARRLLLDNDTTADQTLMIGDSSVDILTGRNAGLWTCGVTYGFAPQSLAEAPPDVLVDTPQELAELLG
jgi:phosphoglycolate phosphatase